ncbi:hypothetical protein IC575_019988 [Cucumis melo]
MREVRGFLGLTRYYRRFVHQYRSIDAPLTQLLKKGGFKWTTAQEAFVKLKNAMMTLPMLALPDFSLPFEIETDASGYGIGVVLMPQAFEEGLSKANGFKVIFVVVDHLSKYGHFLTLKHPYIAKTVVACFVKEIVRLHSFPTSIGSNRDNVFLSNFWRELFVWLELN